MVVAPSFNRFEAGALDVLNSDAPRVAIGLHFTLTAPFRPLSQGFAPLRDGAFLPLGTIRSSPACCAASIRDALAAEVARQLQAFRDAFGRAPDFIDGHQHVHLFPQVSEAVLDGREGARARRLAAAMRARDAARRTAQRSQGAAARRAEPPLPPPRRGAGRAHQPGLRGRLCVPTTPRISPRCFRAFSTGCRTDSVVMCHPGFVDDELQRLDPLTTLREQEYAFLIGDAFPAVLAKSGVTLADAAHSRLAQVVHAG